MNEDRDDNERESETTDEEFDFPSEESLAGTPSGLLNLARVAPEAVALPLLFAVAAATSALSYPQAYLLACLLAALWGVVLPDKLRALQPQHVAWKAMLLLGLALLLFSAVARYVSAGAVAAGPTGDLSLLDLIPWWAWCSCALLVLVGLAGFLQRSRVAIWIGLAASRHLRWASLGILILVVGVGWAHGMAVAADAALRAG